MQTVAIISQLNGEQQCFDLPFAQFVSAHGGANDQLMQQHGQCCRNVHFFVVYRLSQGVTGAPLLTWRVLFE